MKKLIGMTGPLFVSLLAVGLLATAGCEGDDSSSSSSIGDLSVSPMSVSFSSSNSVTVAFEADGGDPEYTWTVNDPALGTVVGAGDAAIYTSTANPGQNFLTVTDGNSNSVSATITQQ